MDNTLSSSYTCPNCGQCITNWPNAINTAFNTIWLSPICFSETTKNDKTLIQYFCSIKCAKEYNYL